VIVTLSRHSRRFSKCREIVAIIIFPLLQLENKSRKNNIFTEFITSMNEMSHL
jgi:hypothetical protein